jgi:hypothetical protein
LRLCCPARSAAENPELPRHGNFFATFSTPWKKLSTPWKLFSTPWKFRIFVFHTVEVPDFSLPLQNSRPARALWPPSHPAQSGYPRSESKEQSKMSVLDIFTTILYLVSRFETFLNFLFLQPLRRFPMDGAAFRDRAFASKRGVTRGTRAPRRRRVGGGTRCDWHGRCIANAEYPP